MSGWQLLPMAIGVLIRPFFRAARDPSPAPPQPVHTPFCHHQAPRDQIAPLSCLTSVSIPANVISSRWAWCCLGLKYTWALLPSCLQSPREVGQTPECGARQGVLTVGLAVEGWGPGSVSLSWGLQPHSCSKASLRAFSSFPQLRKLIAQTELREIRKVPQLGAG